MQLPPSSCPLPKLPSCDQLRPYDVSDTAGLNSLVWQVLPGASAEMWQRPMLAVSPGPWHSHLQSRPGGCSPAEGCEDGCPACLGREPLPHGASSSIQPYSQVRPAAVLHFWSLHTQDCVTADCMSDEAALVSVRPSPLSIHVCHSPWSELACKLMQQDGAAHLYEVARGNAISRAAGQAVMSVCSICLPAMSWLTS